MTHIWYLLSVQMKWIWFCKVRNIKAWKTSKHIPKIYRGQICIKVCVPKWSYDLLYNYNFWSWKVGVKHFWEKFYTSILDASGLALKKDELPFWDKNDIEGPQSTPLLWPCHTIMLYYQSSPTFCDKFGMSCPYYRTFIGKTSLVSRLISRSCMRSRKGLFSRTYGNQVTCWNSHTALQELKECWHEFFVSFLLYAPVRKVHSQQ